MLCFLCERYLPHKKHIMLGQIFLSMGGLDPQNCGVLIYQKHLIYHLAFIKKKERDLFCLDSHCTLDLGD